MTTSDNSTVPDNPTDPPKRNKLVAVVLGLGLLLVLVVAATAYWSLSSGTAEETDEASDVWVGNGWESTKIPADEVHIVLSEIDRYRVRLDTDPEYQEADFYTDLFHANTFDVYRDMIDYYYDSTLHFYRRGEERANDAELHIRSCDTLDAYFHLVYVRGTEPVEDIDEGEEEAGLWQGEIGGRLAVDLMLHAIAVYGDDDLQETMDECGLNDRQ